MSRRRDRYNSRSEESEFSEDSRQDRRSDSYNKGRSESDKDIEKTASKTLENEQSVANGNALCSSDNAQNVDKASQEEELGKAVLEVIGSPIEERKLLVKKFSPPSNCLFVDPPQLNIQLKVTLQDAVSNRDTRIKETQEKITACIGGVMQVLATVLQMSVTEKLIIIETLGGVTRLLADMQHEETIIRRKLVLKNINATLRDALNAAESGELLFGKNLDETMKTAKSLESTTKTLKPKATQNSNVSKNLKGPPRHQQYRRQNGTASSGQRRNSYNSKYQSTTKPWSQNRNQSGNQTTVKKRS